MNLLLVKQTLDFGKADVKEDSSPKVGRKVHLYSRVNRYARPIQVNPLVSVFASEQFVAQHKSNNFKHKFIKALRDNDEWFLCDLCGVKFSVAAFESIRRRIGAGSEEVVNARSNKIVLTPMDKMPFGKYKGQLINTVPTSYMSWLKQQEWIKDWPALYAYLQGAQ